MEVGTDVDETGLGMNGSLLNPHDGYLRIYYVFMCVFVCLNFSNRKFKIESKKKGPLIKKQTNKQFQNRIGR